MHNKLYHCLFAEDFGFQHPLWVYSGRWGAYWIMGCYIFFSWITNELILWFFAEDFGFQHRLWVYSGRLGAYWIMGCHIFFPCITNELIPWFFAEDFGFQYPLWMYSGRWGAYWIMGCHIFFHVSQTNSFLDFFRRGLWVPAPPMGVLGASWRALLGMRRGGAQVVTGSAQCYCRVS